MSYDKCKYISLDEKHNKIKVTIASNNVFPLDWNKVEIYKKDEYSFEDKLLLLFVDLEQGNIQISAINKSTLDIEYALCKVREYCNENNIDSYEDLYKACHKVYKQDTKKSNLEIYKEVYGKCFEIFKKSIKEKIDGDYKVIVYGCYNVSKLGQYRGCYQRFYFGGSPAVMPYKQAFILAYDTNRSAKDKCRIEKV